MSAVSVVLVAASPLAVDLADDTNVKVALATAERLGGRYDLIVPCGEAPAGETDLHPLHVHRVPARSMALYVRAARRCVDRLALDRRARARGGAHRRVRRGDGGHAHRPQEPRHPGMRVGAGPPSVPDARLAIAGEGPCRRRTEALIADLGIAHNVELLGEVSYREIRWAPSR